MVAASILASSACCVRLAILGTGRVGIEPAAAGAGWISFVDCRWCAVVDCLISDPVDALIGRWVRSVATRMYLVAVDAIVQSLLWSASVSLSLSLQWMEPWPA